MPDARDRRRLMSRSSLHRSVTYVAYGMSVGSRLGVMSISRFRLTREQTAPCWLAVLLVIAILMPGAARGETTVSLGGFTLVNKGLIAFGRIPAGVRDKFGETSGSGSGLAAAPI